MTSSISDEPQIERVSMPDRPRISVGWILVVLAVAAVAAACGGSAPAAGDAPPTTGARTTIADDRVGPLLNALIIIGATESPVRRALD